MARSHDSSHSNTRSTPGQRPQTRPQDPPKKQQFGNRGAPEYQGGQPPSGYDPRTAAGAPPHTGHQAGAAGHGGHGGHGEHYADPYYGQNDDGYAQDDYTQGGGHYPAGQYGYEGDNTGSHWPDQQPEEHREGSLAQHLESVQAQAHAHSPTQVDYLPETAQGITQGGYDQGYQPADTGPGQHGAVGTGTINTPPGGQHPPQTDAAADPAYTGFRQDYGGQGYGDQSVPDASYLNAGPAVLHEAEDSGRGGRGKMILTLVTLAGIGGGVGYAWNEGWLAGDGSSGPPPLVRNDSGPVKTRPDNPGGKSFAYSGNRIYDKMQGNSGKDSARLVSREEKVNDPLKSSGTTTKDDGRLTTTSDTGLAGSHSRAQAPGAPRRVKTLVVRPDGTIVRPQQAAAKEQPVSPQQMGGVVGGVMGDFSRAELDAMKKSAAVSSASVQRKAAEKAAEKAAAARPKAKDRVKAAAAAARPKAAPKPKRVAALATKKKPASTGPKSLGTGNYVVQLSSQRSETEALSAFADLQKKYPSILSDHIPLIQRADLGDRGVWYRLRVGPLDTKGTASDVCNKLKVKGWKSCFVRAL